MNKVVVYTVITNAYDYLNNHIDIPEYDFIAYIDDKSIVPANTNWEIRDIPEEILHLSPLFQSIYLKINAHKILSDYDISIYLDGKCMLKNDCKDLLLLDYEDKRIISNKHPKRDCIYDEIITLSNYKWESKDVIIKLFTRYINEDFPYHYGLIDTCFILRYHNDPYVIEIMETWWDDIITNNITRIELNFNYILWKTNKQVSALPYDNYTSKYFILKPHYQKHYTF